MSACSLIWSVARASSQIVAIGFLMLACSLAFAAGETYETLMDDGYAQLKQGEAERLDGEADREARHFRSASAHFDQALGHDKAALLAFQAAESAFQGKLREAPRNAVFFQGVALNEMGQATVDDNLVIVNPKLGAPKEFCAAIHCIERSISPKMTPTENRALYFELGWALIGANKFAGGLGQLKQFLATAPIDPSLKARAEQLIRFANEQLHESVGHASSLRKTYTAKKSTARP